MRSSAAKALLAIAGAMAGVPLAAQVPRLPVAATAGLPTSFVPGSRTIFDLNLAAEPLGGFPRRLSLQKGNVEVVAKNGAPMLKASMESEFLITLPEPLPQDFTLELELIPKACCNPDDLMLEGTPSRNRGANSAELVWDAEALRVVGGGTMYQAPMPPDLSLVVPSALTRVNLSFQGPTITLYTNGKRLYTLDRQFVRGQVLRVFLGGQDDNKYAVYLARLRVAEIVAGSATQAMGVNTTPAPQVTAVGGQTPATPAPAPISALPAAAPTGTITPMASALTPVNVTVTLVGSMAKVTWTSPPLGSTDPAFPADPLEDYFVERWPDGGGCPQILSQTFSLSVCFKWWSQVPWVDDDAGLEFGTKYYYRVLAETHSGRVYPSGVVSVTTPVLLNPLQATRNLAATSLITPQSVTATLTSSSSAQITWRGLTMHTVNPGNSNETLAGFDIKRWPDGFQPDCPTLCRSWFTNVGALSEDFGLQGGTKYYYRVSSVYSRAACQAGCGNNYYAAPDVTLTTPVNLVGTGVRGPLTVLPPHAYLQARLGTVGLVCLDGGWLGGSGCRVWDLTYSWAPQANAVSYILAFDEIITGNYGTFLGTSELGVSKVAASQAPSLWTSHDAGKTVRACLALVIDAANPPDPRKGECIQTDLPP